MNPALQKLAVWTAAVAATALVIGAAASDPQGLFGPTVAAWLQAIGSIVAIFAVVSIDRGAAKRDREAKQEAAAAVLAACSRLTTLFAIKAESRLGILKEKRRVRSGTPIVRSFTIMVETMRQFPVASIPKPEAVVLFTEAVETADWITQFVQQLDDMDARVEKMTQEELTVWAVERLGPMVASIARTDKQLRELAGL